MSSVKMKSLTFLVLQKVKDSLVSSKDGVLDIFKKNLTEVIEKLDVLVLGILLELLGQLLELVNQDISTELSSTKRSTELEKVKEEELKIMPPLMLILLKRTLLLWEVSLTMVL